MEVKYSAEVSQALAICSDTRLTHEQFARDVLKFTDIDMQYLSKFREIMKEGWLYLSRDIVKDWFCIKKDGTHDTNPTAIANFFNRSVKEGLYGKY